MNREIDFGLHRRRLGAGRIVDLLCQPDTAMGRVAAGSVHHIAFRAKDEAEQLQWREHLVDLGYNVTPVIDRTYFHSIYFREPGGVLFEIATEPPGFTLDEKWTNSVRIYVFRRGWNRRGHRSKKFSADSSANEIVRPQPDFIHEFIPAARRGTLCCCMAQVETNGISFRLDGSFDPNAALLSPAGKVLENGMPRFFRRLAEGVFDIEDLKYRTNELADFVTAAAQHYGFATDQLVAVGYSNGANIAASILLLGPEFCIGQFLFRAMVPLIPDAYPELSSGRVWIGAGDQDPIVPAIRDERLENSRRAGADVTIRFFKPATA
jgi:predicted esterase